MEKPMEAKTVSLLRSVEERALAKKTKEEKTKQQLELMRYLPKDCVSFILAKLPAEALQISRFVCKPWYNIINDPKFIDDNLRRSETVFIFASPDKKEGHNNEMVSIFPENPNSFSVEAQLHEPRSAIIVENPFVRRHSKLYIKFLELKDGRCRVGEFDISCLGNIRATCNGLVLLDNKLKKGGLVVMNPITRKLMPLPLGTLVPFHDESYSLSLSKASGEYKVVHLFRDYGGYFSCEVMNIGGRSWREIDGPSTGLLSWLGYDPVSALGALHWTPHLDHSEYIVSMEVDEEKFHQIALPKRGRIFDRIVELNGFLSFAAHNEFNNQIDIWVLRGLFGDVWMKLHTITAGCVLDMVAFSSLRIKGDIVFRREEDGSIHRYDFELQEMKKSSLRDSVACFPHVNSLVSW